MGLKPQDGTLREKGPPPVAWYKKTKLDERGIAFRKNLETLIREISQDGGRVFLAPFRASPQNEYTQGYQKIFFANEKRLMGDIKYSSKHL